MTNDYSHRPLHKYFFAVPKRYDLINRLFTWRMDERWRKKAVTEILKEKPLKVMDLCTGTGDLAVHISRHAGEQVEVTGFDYSIPMLEIASEKSIQKGQAQIEFIHGDAASMPFPDGHFDSIGIAFAFRNLTYKNPDSKKFLSEIIRVLKSGGRFVIVESSQPQNHLLSFLFRNYTVNMVYRLGSLISGNLAAYKYLSTSVINYYNPEEICDMLKSAGFREVSFKRLLGGVAAMHVAVK